WKLKPPAVGVIIDTCMPKSAGTAASETLIAGRSVTSGRIAGSPTTAPCARFSAAEYFTSETRAAWLLSTGDITAQIAPGVAGVPSGGSSTVNVMTGSHGSH